ncbi:MAG: hypothetical protein WAQ52_19945, partial [Terriglobales bacterium]
MQAVIQLHRLREVLALVGFTRLEAVTPDINGEYETDVERAKFGTQICRKRFSSINCRISCASWRSVFCLPTRFVRISAASPI